MTFDEAMDKFEERVEAACTEAGHEECIVTYSNYQRAETDDDDAEEDIIDNLDQVAIQGKVIFYMPPDDFFGGEETRAYRSEVVENPTWLQVCVLANAMIVRTGDTHHCYLESIDVCSSHHLRDVPPGVQVYEFCMGS